MKRGVTVLIAWVFAVCATGLAQEAPIRNFLQVNSEFCTAGQPTLEQLSKLKEDGIRTVLNLRVPSEHDAAAEKAAVLELGMNYFNIPVAGANVRDEQVEAFLTLTDDVENRPIFIHCASANRVGAFWMIRRVVREDWSVTEAEAEAAEIGLRSEALRDFALRYIDAQGLR